jgi:hypothetical protein
MTLPEVLRQVDRFLGDIGCGHVTIERTGCALRFEPARYAPERYAVMVRNVRADSTVAWTPGDASGACFTIADVLATDWMIAS